jgi:hypothetical protein
MDSPRYRFRRPIEGPAGWTSIELTDDVLDAARSGLGDVRILAANGEEVPFMLGAAPAAPPQKLTLFDVEQSDKETTALLDRGPAPPRADSVELLTTETDFIKPVSVDASNDRATWRRIGRGSIFATRAGVRLTRVQFAPSDHRYWRLTLDDRNGSPLEVSEVIAGATARREEPRRTLPLEIKPEPDVSPSTTTWSATLPHRNLRVAALSIRASDPAFARRVRVFERVWFRDEVSRRLLGEAEVVRAPGGEPSSVPLNEPVGKQIEIDIDRAGGVPLHDVSAQVAIEPRVLRFHAIEGNPLELVYGAEDGALPAYDLDAALDGGAPPTFAPAKLGAVIDNGASGPALPAVVRGSTLDRSGWKNEHPILLPPRGPIAYLDVDRGSGPVDDLRIVDGAGRQVPYIVEREARHARFPLTHRVERKGKETHVLLDGLSAEKALQAIELEIAAPEYFSRQITVYERTTDDRGATPPRIIGSMRLVKTAEAPASRFRVPVALPEHPNLEIVVDDGDNAPLVVQTATAEVGRRRLNFVFEAGDDLKLLSGNDQVPVPSYDLALVAARVLASPAEAATLGEARTIAKTPRPPAPGWFWIFVFAAAVILFVALGRTLTGTPAKPS